MSHKEIPKDVKRKLEAYAPKFGKKIEDLEKEYNTYIPKVKEKFPGVSEASIPQKALEMLANDYRRKYGSTRSSADLFEGFFDGESGLRDQVQEKIRSAKYIIQREGKESAMLRGIINEDGTPIDDRATIFNRRKNTNFGRALANAPPTYIKTFYGVARKKGETEFYPVTLTAFEEMAEKIQVKKNKPCEFRCGEGKSRGQLFVSASTQMHPISADEIDWKMEDVYDNLVIPCSEIEARMNSREWDAKDVRIMVDVVNINPNPINDRGDKVIGIADLSLDFNETISCFVPGYVPLDFGQDSKVVIMGRARAYKEQPSMNAYGIWPVPGQTTSITSVSEMSSSDVMVGWVDDEDEGPI
jgi:hypothetical protein